ncbi:MAG: sulfatase family protein [Candidatus Cyclobacteriaceae bacterium M3_2C_046]
MRSIKLWLLLLLSLASIGLKAQQDSPNIIFILIDDQRYDFLSYLDHPWIETPHIDQLAQNSLYFDNAFVTTSLCSPSRASIITGQYAHAHQVMDNDTPLPANIPAFPKKLQDQGYQTAFVGKWHMGGNNDMPRPGFDHWVSFKGQGPYFDPTLNIDGKQVARKGYTTDILTEYANQFIRKASQQTTPYFLYLSHKAIHESFVPAPRHQGKYAELSIPLPETYADTEENYVDKPLWMRRQRTSWHGAERDYSIQNYGSFNRFFQLYSEAMLAVDESVGEITQTLQELGQLDNTVIFYYSDNGYLMGEHGLIDKRVMYEESIRVPAFVHWPAVIEQPEHREEMILNIDIGPTILELAGATIPASMHGLSFARIIKEQPLNWRKAFLYEYFIDPNAVQTPTILGLRTEKYSYMTYEGVWDIYELYDLEKDPHQKHNLLGHIRYGHDYGTFLQHVYRQDPEIWPLVQQLDQKLSQVINENGGSRQPEWKKD